MMNNYNDEQKILFENYLDKSLLASSITKNDIRIVNDAVELIVRTQCDQKCEYCYITRHGEELYPYHADKKTLLNNIKMLLDYFSKRNVFFPKFEIFGGELFADDLFFDIVDILEQYYIKYMKIFGNRFFYDLNTEILLPTNLYWALKYPDKKEKFKIYWNRFKNNYNIPIGISWSTDGLYAEETREQRHMSQKEFDILFEFVSEIKGGCHPMISASNIYNWTHGNFMWWKSQLYKWFYKYNDQAFYYLPAMLEVRNNDWTDESLKEYEKFLKTIFSDRLELCQNSGTLLAKHLFNRIEENEKELIPPTLETIDPIRIHPFDLDCDERDADRPTCSFSTIIYLNCNNLSIACCHRLTYDMLTPIYFITNDDNTEIIDYKVNNIDGYIALNSMKRTAEPICNNCMYNYICLHGCFGAQFEEAQDILLPCKNACKMFDVKYRTLFKLYHEAGVWKEVFEQNYFNSFVLNSLIDILSKMGYTEYEQYAVRND